jgi:hypothetical protein
MVVNTELTERRKRRMNRMLKSAHSASIEGIEFGRPRGPERSQILSLAESNWIDPYHSILIVGATEVGKTYIGCACKRGGPARGMRRSTCANRAYTTKFLARADGRLPRFITTLARTNVLLLDCVFRPRRHRPGVTAESSGCYSSTPR